MQSWMRNEASSRFHSWKCVLLYKDLLYSGDGFLFQALRLCLRFHRFLKCLFYSSQI